MRHAPEERHQRGACCDRSWRGAGVLGAGCCQVLPHLGVRGPSGQWGQGGQRVPAGISPGVQDRVWGVRALRVKQGRHWLPSGS